MDCRWELGIQRGRELYLAGHIPGASFLDVDEDLSDLSVPDAGRHPLPSAERFAAAAGRAGIGAGSVRRRVRVDGRRRAALVAAPPLRPRRLRRPARGDRRLGRRAAGGRRGDRAGGVRPARARRRHDRTRRRSSAVSPTRRSRSSTRARRTAGAASRTRSTTRPAASPALPTRPGTSRCRSCRPASSSPTAARASRPASRSTAPGSPAARAASTRLVERVVEARAAARARLATDSGARGRQRELRHRGRAPRGLDRRA